MKQFLKFAAVGVFNTLLGYSIIFLCMYWLGMSAVMSNIIGYLGGITVSYLLNRKFTFNGTVRSAREALRFVIVFFIAYLINLGILLSAIHYSKMHEGIAQILAGAIYVIASYLLNKYYVFQSAVRIPIR